MIKQLHIVPDYHDMNETLRLCDRYGLSFEYNDFFAPSLLDDKSELSKRIDFYKGLNRKSDCDSLHGAFLDICVNSADQKIVSISKDRMYQSMDIAERLECKKVIFHSGVISRFNNKDYQDRWLECYSEFYRELLAEFKGIKIAVENMFDDSPDMLSRLADNLSEESDFGICFDVAHANIWGDNIEEWIDRLAAHISHLHINDNDGRTDLHSAVGTGNIDWDKYFRLIGAPNLSCDMLLEVRTRQQYIESMEYLTKKNYISI